MELICSIVYTQKWKYGKLFLVLELSGWGSNRSIDPIRTIYSFLVGVVLGSRRLAHNGMLRSDDVIKEIFGWRHSSPSASTYSRFFQQLNRELIRSIFQHWKKI